jgi:uncharacterized membrane protein YphA (DoxX/SURF4 family)
MIGALLRVAMQRLYSTFPNALPGKGLLVLRLAVGLPLIFSGVPYLARLPELPLAALPLVSISIGLLLLVGLWTPFAASMQLVIAIWAAFSRATVESSYLVSAAVGLGLVLLGPGAASADALLFGRKRIDIQ